MNLQAVIPKLNLAIMLMISIFPFAFGMDYFMKTVTEARENPIAKNKLGLKASLFLFGSFIYLLLIFVILVYLKVK